MKKQNLTLPEWAFLDGASHLGNTLEGRDILMHVRSNTVMEIFAVDETTVQLNPETKQKEFTYKNQFGISEHHIIAVHYTLASDFEIGDIVNKAIDFYCKYLTWEDKNIMTEDKSKIN